MPPGPAQPRSAGPLRAQSTPCSRRIVRSSKRPLVSTCLGGFQNAKFCPATADKFRRLMIGTGSPPTRPAPKGADSKGVLTAPGDCPTSPLKPRRCDVSSGPWRPRRQGGHPRGPAPLVRLDDKPLGEPISERGPSRLAWLPLLLPQGRRKGSTLLSVAACCLSEMMVSNGHIVTSTTCRGLRMFTIPGRVLCRQIAKTRLPRPTSAG